MSESSANLVGEAALVGDVFDVRGVAMIDPGAKLHPAAGLCEDGVALAGREGDVGEAEAVDCAAGADVVVLAGHGGKGKEVVRG